MEFAQYLKKCRESFGLTQEELARELFLHSEEEFSGVDASVLSKWERGILHPGYRRKAKILAYFQILGRLPLPCWRGKDPEYIERSICRKGMDYILARPPRELVVDLSMDLLKVDDFRIIPLRHFDRKEELLEIHLNLHTHINPPFSRLSLEQFETWSLHPDSFFYVVLYKRTFLGLLFAQRLKWESYLDLMEFRRQKNDLTLEDLADAHEEAGINLIAHFSFDSRVTSMLMVRLYAYLIAHQETIREVGIYTPLEDLHRVAERMNLQPRHVRQIDGHRYKAYRNTLHQVMACEGAMRLLFPKKPASASAPSPGDRSDDPAV